MQRWRAPALARKDEAVYVCRRGLNAFIIIIYKETYGLQLWERSQWYSKRQVITTTGRMVFAFSENFLNVLGEGALLQCVCQIKYHTLLNHQKSTETRAHNKTRGEEERITSTDLNTGEITCQYYK